VTDTVMAYVSYSEGFKSGGFTQRVFPPIVAGETAPPGTPAIDLIPTYDPEFVDSYEIGVKATAWDGRMRLNGAVFHSEYEDMQVQVFNSVAPVTENIGRASIDGLELELTMAPGEGWLVEASLAWLDAEYDDIDTGITLIGEDFEFERVPEFSSSLGASKEFVLGDAGFLVLRGDWSYQSSTYNDAYNTPDAGFLVLRGDWSYQSSTYNDAYNTPQLKTDSYHLLDASLRWRNRGEDWSVILSGLNLGDEQYLVTGVYGTAFQAYEGAYSRGREWRLELRKDF
jgi:iron complex outermembrane receptor protein